MKTSTWQCGTPRASCSGGSDILLSFTHSLLSGGIFMFLSTQGLGNNGAGDLNIYCNHLSLSANNTYYVAPIPLGQAPVQVVAYQPPPGYALVPMAEVRKNPLLEYQILTARNPLDIKVLSSQNQFSFSSSKQLGTHLPLPHTRRQLLENCYPHFGRLNHLCLLLTALTVPSIDVYKM